VRYPQIFLRPQFVIARTVVHYSLSHFPMKNLLKLFALCSCVLGVAVAAESQPTAEEASKGLQAALTTLVDQSVATASDAKKADAELSITLPDKMAKLESMLRGAGQGQLVDDFKAKVKKVAVETLPLTKDVFKGETSNLKIDDPMTVLKTGPDGLTNYAKQKTRPAVVGKVQPLITAKSKEAGVTAAYQAMVAKAGPFAASMFGKEPPANFEQSVTEQTVDFVYGQMGKGEGALRVNPSIAKNALVTKIFAAVKK